MKSNHVFLLFLLIVSQALGVPDICWRDYTGIIPDDALVGGRDENNEPTYIGQALIPEGLMIGTIYKGTKSVNVQYYGLKTVNHHIKILCTSKPYRFYWIPVTWTTVNLLTKPYLVIGGYETNDTCDLKIGRVFYKNEVVVGKVICNPKETYLYFVKSGEATRVTTYEILAYDENRTPATHAKSVCCHNTDVELN